MKEGNKRYLVQITEVSSEKGLTDQEWTILEEVGDVKNRGYTPQIETTKKVQREVFKQNVSELDLIAVIKAVNGIN
jgi:hypothetical protein